MVGDYSRYLWITALILVIAAFFTSNVEISPGMSIISVMFIIFLSIPCFASVILWLGWKKGLITIIILSIYAFSIETFAIITGFPYSPFHYTDMIGMKIFGYTPFTVPFAYVPLFLGCIYLASKRWSENLKIILATAFLVLVVDLVLDPAAVSLNFWVYEHTSIFYGVPLQNFLGWILTGAIAALIGLLILKNELKSYKPPAMVSSLFLIMCFWTAVCFYRQLWVPSVIGMIFLILILKETEGRIGDFRLKNANSD
ncbi:MAG: carotenoid biosynthesis protein [Methanobacteriaceae archaeon]|nr:carotenoid biosynthesis protein [Methanobacteriaceae archaeon]